MSSPSGTPRAAGSSAGSRPEAAPLPRGPSLTTPTARLLQAHLDSAWSGQAGLITWRRRYVPHVGQATWGSLGSWHCGQLTSVGALVFHCERRERVLLRDILRLGTATSALLSVFGAVAAAVLVFGIIAAGRQLAQRLPLGENRALVLVARAGVGQPGPALGAQPGAVVRAQWGQRQGEHH